MRSAGELEAGLDYIRQSPKVDGVLQLIARRPKAGGREILTEGVLDPDVGLVGDKWSLRSDVRTRGRAGALDAQVTIMNARVAELVAESPARWVLAGDQLFVDFDLSRANLPSGTRLAVGSAILEVSPEPHTGCRKFVSHFGVDAMKFVNSALGRALNLRGINSRVVRRGDIRVGDRINKLA